MKVYRTQREDVYVDEASGWVRLPGTNVEITALPYMDRAQDGLFAARVGHGFRPTDADRIAGPEEYIALRALALYVEPVTLPTQAMCNAAGARTEAQVNAFRQSNMMGLEWARLHCDEVKRRADAEGWDGKQPIVEWGKHWVPGGGIWGWQRKNGTLIQPLSYFHRSEPTYSDYGTTVHGLRVVGYTPGMRPTIRTGATGEHVTALQKLLSISIDGKFGPKTKGAVEVFQREHGLSADGVVGPKTWAVLEPDAAPIDALQRQAIKTPISAVMLFAALSVAWRFKFETEPPRNALLVLLAQSAIETANWRSLWNYNLGNVKRMKGHPWMMLANVWEIIGGQKVVFQPPHPQTHFRAFDTLEAGASAYLDILHGRFAPAWQDVIHGEPEAFAMSLKRLRYYTADAGAYARSMRERFDVFARAVV